MKVKILSIKPAKNPRARFIALTGTPVTESPLNAYSLARLISPELACSKQKFDAFFVETEVKFFGGARINKVKGYKNLDKLQELLASFAIRRVTAAGMPDKVKIERIVELSPAQKKAYNELAKSARSQISQEGADKAESATVKLRQFLNDPKIVDIDLESPKLDVLDEILEEILEDPETKVVVWTSYIGQIPQWLERYKRYKAIGVYGPTTAEEIARYRKTFDHSDQRMVIATPQKAGTGTDWFSRARYAVYLDRPWSAALSKQSEDRLIRRVNAQSTDPIELIKARPATLISLHVRNSVDNLVKKIIERKINLAEGVDVSNDKIEIPQEEVMACIKDLE